jgi:hypothetical protein
MAASEGTESIADDELLYRRVPVSKEWYNTTEGLSPEAFQPRDDETRGISVYRAKYKSIEEAAKGKGKRGYYVAVLCAGDLRKQGIQVVPRPGPDDPGHAELPDLTCYNRETPEADEKKLRLTELSFRVEGPFVSTTA